jgi:hypothetical protein
MEKANFDPAAYWTGLGLPIEMLKVVQGSGGKEAVCEYCACKVDLFGGYLERHTDGAQHKMRVKTYKINTESKIQAFKTGYPLESVQSKKRDWLELDTSPALVDATRPSPPPKEEKKRKTMSEIIRAECTEQLNKVRDECITKLKNAQAEYVMECEAELKKIDWKALIAEEARNHVRNMVKDMFEKDALLE